MSTKLRILAILLLIIPTMAVTRTEARESGSVAHKHSAHERSSARKSATEKIKTSARRGGGVSSRHRVSRTAARRKAPTPTVRRMARAFVASADLKPMARQLVENRTPAAYAGVEGYARRHDGSDAGAMAWLAVGYAHFLDEQYAPAISALEKASPQAGELSDYVEYLEAACYAGLGNSAKVVELLQNFDGLMPESIFQKEVVAVYGNALAAQGRTQEAITYLEAHRQPVRAAVELALGRSYLHSESPEKGMEILKHLYFTMPVSSEGRPGGSSADCRRLGAGRQLFRREGQGGPAGEGRAVGRGRAHLSRTRKQGSGGGAGKH